MPIAPAALASRHGHLRQYSHSLSHHRRLRLKTQPCLLLHMSLTDMARFCRSGPSRQRHPLPFPRCGCLPRPHRYSQGQGKQLCAGQLQPAAQLRLQRDAGGPQWGNSCQSLTAAVLVRQSHKLLCRYPVCLCISPNGSLHTCSVVNFKPHPIVLYACHLPSHLSLS